MQVVDQSSESVEWILTTSVFHINYLIDYRDCERYQLTAEN